MLEKLETINWLDLGLREMPLWLWGLTSPNSEVRKISTDYMYDHHLFDGSLHYTGIPKIVPFLIELLEEDNIQEKDGIVLMLMQLADAAIVALRRDLSDAVAIETYNNIKEGKHIYEDFLSSPDAFTVETATQLLKYLSQ